MTPDPSKPHRPEIVLVVDDDVQCRRLVLRLLAELGFHTSREATSASEALSLLACERVDVVLTDWAMEDDASGSRVVDGARRAGIPVGLVYGVRPWHDEARMAALAQVSKDALTVDSLRRLMDQLLHRQR